MSSYQYSSYQQQQLPYTSKGGRSWFWSDAHKKPSGTYDNATGYSSFGVGGLATSAKGQFWSGAYGGDSEYQSGSRYASNEGQWRSGGCKIQTYPNNVRICACSVLPSYQSETHLQMN